METEKDQHQSQAPSKRTHQSKRSSSATETSHASHHGGEPPAHHHAATTTTTSTGGLQHHQRNRSQKHLVGGAGGAGHGHGAGSRLHTRTSSSKALHNRQSASTASITKLLKEQARREAREQEESAVSPNEENRALAAAAFPPVAAAPGSTIASDETVRPAAHRRGKSSEERIRPLTTASRNSSSSNLHMRKDKSTTDLRKNTSQVSLRRNKSGADIAGKRHSKSSSQIKRTSSEKSIGKIASRPASRGQKSQVHFDLGNGTAGEEEEDEEEWVDASNSASPYLSKRSSAANSSGPSSRDGPAGKQVEDSDADRQGRDTSPEGSAQVADLSARKASSESKRHSSFLTSRLLERTPSRAAIMTSNMTASVRSSQNVATSPKLRPTRTSDDGEDDDSRFIDADSRRANASLYKPEKQLRVSSAPGDESTLQFAQRPPQTQSDATDGADDAIGSAGTNSAFAPRINPKRTGQPSVPPAEKSRTQQKLNLQRASSSLEPRRHPKHSHGSMRGFSSGPPESGEGMNGYEPSSSQIHRILERTGAEYLIVRRYQNPVARSLARLQLLPGADKGRQIPRPGTSNTTGPSNGHAKRDSNMSQHDFREEVARNPRRTFSTMRADELRDDERRGLHQNTRLSGSSLVNPEQQEPNGGGGDDDNIQAILRSLWDKNLDLSASQD